MLKRFFYYGISGNLLELLWTGINSFFSGDLRLMGHSSLVMFFIYGMAVFMEPVFTIFKEQFVAVRLLTYSSMIFMMEYYSGLFLNKFYICPWYYNSIFNVNHIIRLDYIILWCIVGYVYEKMFYRWCK